MDNTKKISIDDKAIWEIKDFAAQCFKNERDLSRFSTKDLQIYLILQGLERFLLKNGQNPGFDLPKPPVHDSFPIDDSGLDQVDEEPVLPQVP